MTDKPTRRRRRLLLVPLVGVVAWAVRSRLVDRAELREGWQPLPPRPVAPPGREEPAAASAPELGRPPVQPAEPVAARTQAVPAASAVASVTAPVTVPVTAADLPFGPGSARAGDDGAAPNPEYAVKGKTATRVFYAPGSPYYGRTRADVWFRTPDDAVAAGFTPRAPRKAG